MLPQAARDRAATLVFLSEVPKTKAAHYFVDFIPPRNVVWLRI
jgi:hypothetical protein